MTADSDTADKVAALLRDRLAELSAEHGRLERALASLTDDRASRRGPPKRRSRRTAAAKASGSSPKGARRRSSRADQALELILAKPGTSASEVARKLKVKPNYIYRVLSGLEKDGRIRKDGRAYHPA